MVEQGKEEITKWMAGGGGTGDGSGGEGVGRVRVGIDVQRWLVKSELRNSSGVLFVCWLLNVPATG